MATKSRDEVKEAVFAALEAFNDSQEDSKKVEIDEATPLMGGQAVLESIGLVSLIMEIEQQVQEKLQRNVSLTSEKAMAARVSPFRRVRTLIDFIAEELSDEDA